MDASTLLLFVPACFALNMAQLWCSQPGALAAEVAPQFVDPADAVGAQFLVLGGVFLLLELVALAAYAWMGARMQKWFAQPRGKRIFNRSCAGLLAGAGMGLLLSRRN